MDKNQIYWAAFDKWGLLHQLVVALEELSECQKEICKVIRGEGSREHLAEEIADARICLEQVCLFFAIDGKVEEYKKAKLQRLKEKVGK